MRGFRNWATEPVGLPRWMLFVLYVLFILLGVTLALAGSLDVDPDGPPWYTGAYGFTIAALSLVALVTSLIPHASLLECLTAFLLFALLSVYIASTIAPWYAGDLTTGSLGIVVTIASLIPLFRSLVLGNRIIRKWAAR